MNTYYDIKIGAERSEKSYDLKKRNFAAIIAALPKKVRMMEVGPGAGIMIQICQEFGFADFLLIDNDIGVAEHIQSLFGLPVVVTQNMIVELAKVESGDIDLALFCHVLEHLPVELIHEVLTTLREKLSPDGLLVIEMPNIACPIGGLENFYSDATHRTPMTSVALVQALRLAGYEEVIAYPFRPGRGAHFLMGHMRYGLNIVLGGLLNLLSGTKVLRSPSYFVVASGSRP